MVGPLHPGDPSSGPVVKRDRVVGAICGTFDQDPGPEIGTTVIDSPNLPIEDEELGAVIFLRLHMLCFPRRQYDRMVGNVAVILIYLGLRGPQLRNIIARKKAQI